MDEQHCPNCAHDVLNWDIACPGCDQVPWDTPAGRRVIRQRRRRMAWNSSAPFIVILFILFAGVTIVGNINLSKRANFQEVAVNLNQVVAKVEQIEGALADRHAERDFRRAYVGSTQRWLASELPALLDLVKDPRKEASVRLAAASVVARIIVPLGLLSSLAAEHKNEIVEVFMPLARYSEQEEMQTVAYLIVSALEQAPKVSAEGINRLIPLSGLDVIYTPAGRVRIWRSEHELERAIELRHADQS